MLSACQVCCAAAAVQQSRVCMRLLPGSHLGACGPIAGTCLCLPCGLPDCPLCCRCSLYMLWLPAQTAALSPLVVTSMMPVCADCLRTPALHKALLCARAYEPAALQWPCGSSYPDCHTDAAAPQRCAGCRMGCMHQGTAMCAAVLGSHARLVAQPTRPAAVCCALHVPNKVRLDGYAVFVPQSGAEVARCHTYVLVRCCMALRSSCAANASICVYRYMLLPLSQGIPSYEPSRRPLFLCHANASCGAAQGTAVVAFANPPRLR